MVKSCGQIIKINPYGGYPGNLINTSFRLFELMRVLLDPDDYLLEQRFTKHAIWVNVQH